MTVDEVSVVLDTMQPIYTCVGIIIGFILSGLFYIIFDFVIDDIVIFNKDKNQSQRMTKNE